MKNTCLTLSTFVFVCFSSIFAEEPLCNPCDTVDTCRKRSFFDTLEFDGWMQAGSYMNTNGTTTSRYRERNVSFKDPTSGNGYTLGNVHTTDIQLNQLWFNLRKEADSRRGPDWGFRAEYLFGQDAWITQSWNDAGFDYGWQTGDYYSSIPQLFVQLAYKDWSVKAGKYETLIGSESTRAPEFSLYSHGNLYMMEPYSHTGLLAEYNPNERFHFALGYAAGGDSGFENRYNDHGLLYYISYQFTKKWNLSFAVLFTRYGNGTEYPNGDARLFSNEYVYYHTTALTYDITKRLSFLLQWDYGTARNHANGSTRTMSGIGNTFNYQLAKDANLIFRCEWVKDTHGFLALYDEMVSLTLGAKWQPLQNVSFHPEIRYDKATGSKPFNYGANRDQASGGIGTVVKF